MNKTDIISAISSFLKKRYELKPSKRVKPMKKKMSKPQAKVKKVMHEFKEGELHSGSKKGPVVTNPKQAIAISMHEAGLSKKKKKK